MPKPSSSNPTSSTPAPESVALRTAHGVLRILIVLNWVFGAAILAAFIVMPTQEWITKSFGVLPAAEVERLIWGFRGITLLGLVTIPLNYAILKKLLAIVETVRSSDAFVAANANRLKAIAWTLTGLQLLGVAIGAIENAISTPAHPLHLDAGFSINGWLAVLLTFLLAEVFAKGTHMREDLEGTV